MRLAGQAYYALLSHEWKSNCSENEIDSWLVSPDLEQFCLGRQHLVFDERVWLGGLMSPVFS
jgi:hypothetical protein